MFTDTAMGGFTEVVEPGEVVMLAGRPGAGVSTTLASAAGLWAADGRQAVMASWERPAEALLRDFPVLRRAEVLDILGWTGDELGRRLEGAAVGRDTLVAVDYLQLINGPDDVCGRVASLAQRLEVRVLLGAMAPRAVEPLVEAEAPPARLLRAFAENIGVMRGGDPRQIHRLAALVGEGSSRVRRLIVSQRSPNLHQVDVVI